MANWPTTMSCVVRSDIARLRLMSFVPHQGFLLDLERKRKTQRDSFMATQKQSKPINRFKINGKVAATPSARVLMFDIEATNLAADFGRTLCIGYMWLGDKDPSILTVRTCAAWGRDHTNDRQIVMDFRRILADSDCWVTWYGKKYDVPFLQTRLLKHGNHFIPPVPHIDLWWTCKSRLKLHNNRLASASDFFNLTPKTPIRGEAWVRAGAGHKPSLKYVEEHCRADVLSLRDAYMIMRPLVYNHPNTSLITAFGEGCPVCGGDQFVDVGPHLGPKREWRRYRCKSCGHYKNQHGATAKRKRT